MKKYMSLLGLTLLLAGCGDQQSFVNSSQPFFIAKVQVWGPPPAGSSDAQLKDLSDKVTALNSRVPSTNNPVLLSLRITKFHKKNPGISLIVGDANTMELTGTVMSLDGKTQMGTSVIQVQQGGEINGVIGMVAAATTSDEFATHALDQKAANELLEKVYGTKAWKSWERH